MKRTVHHVLSLLGFRIVRDPLDPRRINIRKQTISGIDHLHDIRAISRGRMATVLDVGAHVGRTTLAFAEAFHDARIYSLEPDRMSCERLRRNTCHLPRVHCFNLALGDRHGTALLHRNAYDETNSLLPIDPDAGRFMPAHLLGLEAAETVEVTTLDQFRREQNLAAINLLKLDVQGFELAVLRGAEQSLRESTIDLIYLEVNFVPVYAGQASFAQLLDYLLGFDYRLVGIYECGAGDQPFLVGGNALFVNAKAVSAERPSRAPARPVS